MELKAGQSIRDYQKFHQWLDQYKGFVQDVYLTMIHLSEEVGEVAKEIARYHYFEKSANLSEEEWKAKQAEIKAEIGKELADVLAYTFKLANYLELDMEKEYQQKMLKNIDRVWVNK